MTFRPRSVSYLCRHFKDRARKRLAARLESRREPFEGSWLKLESNLRSDYWPAESARKRVLLESPNHKRHSSSPTTSLEQLLGSGGMGKVYRATHKGSGKSVAVKALHKLRQSDSRAVAHFVQESQILSSLCHPNIVGVEGLGRFPAGGYFIVMDFIDGVDLQSRLQTGPLPIAEVLAIARQLASAVQHAHNHGVVHCDLKPGNVLVDSTNHVFVTDFGFAFLLADPSQRKTDCIGGTAGYMAPEILQAQSQPTPAVDIFAIGVLLWKLATGKLPTDCDSLHAENNATAPIESICRRCLASEPSGRFPEVADLIAALSNIGHDAGEVAT